MRAFQYGNLAVDSTQNVGKRGMRVDLVRREVDKLANELSLPAAIRDGSEKMCGDAIVKNLMGHRSAPVVAASSLYTVCRETHTPVTLKELADAAASNPREIGRCYRSMISRMNIAPPNLNGTAYVFRVAEAVGASAQATAAAIGLDKDSISRGLMGRNPMTLAAASVYLSCLALGEDSKQSEVAEAAGVSEVSVRECIKAMRRVGAV